MKKLLLTAVNVLRLLKDSDVKLTRKLLFLVPLAYLLLPFDLVGDFFPVLGQLDDIAVFILMWPILKGMLAKYKQADPEIRKNKMDPDAVDISQDNYTVE